MTVSFSFVLMLCAALLTGAPQLGWLLAFAALHEGGHLMLLLLFGGKPDSITLAFYGVGLRHSARLTRLQEWLFLLGGIGVNAAFVLLNIHREINLPLFLINAVPIYPLDMGRALRLYLPYRFCRALSAAVLAAMVISAVVLRNASLGLIAAYIIVFSIKEDLK